MLFPLIYILWQISHPYCTFEEMIDLPVSGYHPYQQPYHLLYADCTCVTWVDDNVYVSGYGSNGKGSINILDSNGQHISCISGISNTDKVWYMNDLSIKADIMFWFCPSFTKDCMCNYSYIFKRNSFKFCKLSQLPLKFQCKEKWLKIETLLHIFFKSNWDRNHYFKFDME
jgi:hypothetical protein